MTICVGPTLTEKDIKRLKAEMKFTPDLDELSTVLDIVGTPMRLRIFYLLAELKEICVCDIAEILDATTPGISQHLAKFKAYGLVKTRRDSQTIYYSLKEHPFLNSLKRLLANHIGQDK